MIEEKKKGILQSFPKTYWIVILFEFFERGSYYGMMSVLSVYLTDILGIAKTNVGLIKGTIQPILYFLPILSGALADRFGYRRTLTIAFALLGGGYFLTAQVTSYTAIFLALCVMALGAGIFKPVISGSIARTTDKSNSALGFGIYYWSINLGAFLFPLILVPYLKNSPLFGWKWVIFASAIGTGVMLIPTLFFYKEPPRPDKKENAKEFNLLQTIANAFEIIYSPFVLIYHSLKTSKSKAYLVYAIVALLFVASIWQYMHQAPVTEKLNRAGIRKNDSALLLTIDRNVMKQNPFSIKSQHLEKIEDYNILFSIDKDPNSERILKPVLHDGRDLNVTIYKPDADSLYDFLNKQVGTYVQLSASRLDSVLTRFKTKNTNRIIVTIVKPDDFNEFKKDLLITIQQYKPFVDLTFNSLEGLFQQVQEKIVFTVETESVAEAPQPYRIESIHSDYLKLSLFSSKEYNQFKTEILSKVRQNPNFVTMSQAELDEFVNKSQQRSFFLLYIFLLFVSSLLIMKVQKAYLQSDRAKKTVYNLVTIAGIFSIIWLIPGLNLFSRIVSTVIYLTVLSLFTIEIGDTAKFRDNFRFLLMIFIYSGFWILYFQMFDSVLWYVKAYVDASSLNNFVNSTLGAIGVNINWFFDVEHVTVINAGTIILLQLIVSNIVKNTKALPTMVVGIAMGTVGMAILAISTDIWVFMAGIIIFSIGEMTAHPKLISYVGLTAPKDRVATYMGYIFLYGVIGSSIGAILGANLYVHFVDKLNQPRILWLIFSGIGVATIVGLLLYNKYTPKKSEEDN